LNGGKRLSLTFYRNFSDYGNKLDNSYVAIAYIQNGFVLKLPIFTYNQAQNTPGLVLTSVFYLAANSIAYFLMKQQRAKVNKEKTKKQDIKFGRFLQLSQKVEDYMELALTKLKYNRSLANERDLRGLIILKAYIGLADHVYLYDSGIMEPTVP
jgi:hypothetical protein